MAKLLRIRDYLLIISSIVGEVSEDFRLAGGIVPKAMELKYGFVPPNYKRASYMSTVSKMLSTGQIERIVNSKGEPCLVLTPKGRVRFKRTFPILSLQKQKWDGNFMIVIFDIAEKERYKRDNLRSKLRELGFGKLQESVWISPFHFEDDFREFVKSNSLKDMVFVLSAKATAISDYITLVARVWNLDKLNDDYQKLLDLIENGDGDSKNIWDDYFTLALKDPMLPNELLPKNWLREKVYMALQKLNDRE